MQRKKNKMEELLNKHLDSITELDEDWTVLEYSEDVNKDALSDDWLENRTSFIYKVGVLCAIDRNKCDWVYVVIGTQRGENSKPEVKGTFYFNKGENDDIGRVIKRAFDCMKIIHPVFEED